MLQIGFVFRPKRSTRFRPYIGAVNFDIEKEYFQSAAGNDSRMLFSHITHP